MTVINPNSVAGINSITVASGAALAIHKADGTLIQTIAGATGVSTFSSVSVGSGYTEPPLLSFFDNCDKGYGAGGYVKIRGGSISDVVITSGGQEYLPNTTETVLNSDGSLTEKEVIPDPNANYDGEVSYITQLSDVIVQNVGSGYEQGDTAIVEGGQISDSTIGVDGTTGVTRPGQAEVELQIQDGYVIGANVVNGGFGFTDLPDILINSDTGIGARLTPVLKFTKVEDAKQITEITQDAVVTVISCIQK